jgi:hypothetical protein
LGLASLLLVMAGHCLLPCTGLKGERFRALWILQDLERQADVEEKGSQLT